MTKILLTGSTGYLGSWVLRALKNQGFEVVALVRSLGHSGRDYQVLVDDFFSGQVHIEFDYFIHMANVFRFPHRPSDILPMLEAHQNLPLQVIEYGLKKQCLKGVLNIGSSWEKSLNSLYAHTKKNFSEMSGLYQDRLSWVNLLLYDTYGPGDSRRKFLNLLKNAIHQNDKVFPMSGGEQLVNFLYVEDLVSGVIAALTQIKNGDLKQGEYALRALAPIQLKELAQLAVNLSESSLKLDMGFYPYRDGEIFNPPWVELLPNWKPSWSLQTGLQHFLQKGEVAGV